jgi:hypothetical protein
VKRALVALAVLFAATGCAAAQKGRPYAGMDPYDAGNSARSIIDQETVTPGSELYHRELAVEHQDKGTLPDTRRPAWVVWMESFDHVKSKYCLYLWGRFTPFQGSNVKYAIRGCPDSGGV